MRCCIVSVAESCPSVGELARLFWRSRVLPSSVVAEADPVYGDLVLDFARRLGVPAELVPVGSDRCRCRVALVLLGSSGVWPGALWGRVRAAELAGVRVVVFRRGLRGRGWVPVRP